MALHSHERGCSEYVTLEAPIAPPDLQLMYFVEYPVFRSRFCRCATRQQVRNTGSCPDPGRKHIAKHDQVFSISEQHQISGQDLSRLAGKAMSHVRTVIDNNEGAPV